MGIMSAEKQWRINLNFENFQRKSQGGHLVFQNEANFSHREVYLPIEIAFKFGEASWSSSLLCQHRKTLCVAS